MGATRWPDVRDFACVQVRLLLAPTHGQSQTVCRSIGSSSKTFSGRTSCCDFARCLFHERVCSVTGRWSSAALCHLQQRLQQGLEGWHARVLLLGCFLDKLVEHWRPLRQQPHATEGKFSRHHLLNSGKAALGQQCRCWSGGAARKQQVTPIRLSSNPTISARNRGTDVWQQSSGRVLVGQCCEAVHHGCEFGACQALFAAIAARIAEVGQCCP
mmetsp:Transcript_7781/g.23044  ORF Transcript_7781/g.23044 Transcript_7781/m.23044 type:complete len:214 (+) Transcript_7781:996-1637(+)